MRIAPEAINKRLGSVKFLNASDFGVFEDLRLEVEGLRQPDEALPIVRPNEPEAWARLFRIYRALKARCDRQAAADAQRFHQSAADEQAWNEFMRERQAFLEWLQREPISADTKEYIGLLPDDLGSPTIEGDDAMRFGNPRHPDWRGRAKRISTAMWKLKNMGTAERMNIPNIMQTRRLIEAVNLMNDKLNAVEQKFEWLDERISSLESKFISNKH